MADSSSILAQIDSAVQGAADSSSILAQIDSVVQGAADVRGRRSPARGAAKSRAR